MKIAGIICEYDPFHRGHLRQLRLTREILGEDTAIVCVMSGNYVQRGMPAAWDKFARARAAAACGADVVLELPVTAVLRSAEGFARAGVEILTKFGCTHLSFGTECGDKDALIALAEQMETEGFHTALRNNLDQGMSYAAARQAAAGDEAGLLDTPNNILGLEYCRAILQSGSTMIPLAIQRAGSYHAKTPDTEAPSATAVRNLLPHGPWQEYLPPEAASVLEQGAIYSLPWGERAMLARLRTMREAQWEAAAHGSEGLWRKAMKACRECTGYEELVDAIKSKRYPRTRIQRLLLCAYLGISETQLHAPLPYIRILATSQAGRSLLRTAKDAGDLYLINPGQTPADQDYYALEIQASNLFGLFIQPDLPCPCGAEQKGRINFEKI